VTTYDGCAADYVKRFPRPSPSTFFLHTANNKKTGGVKGMGMRLRPAG